jgi:hypothetical protein
MVKKQSGIGSGIKPKNVWDRLPAESDKAFHAFSTYLQMPVGARNKSEVATMLGYQSFSSVMRWSSDFNWDARVGAYDSHMQALALETQAQSRTEAAENATMQLLMEIDQAAKLMTRAHRILLNRMENPDEFKMHELKTFVDSMRNLDDLRRRALGMPTVFTRQVADQLEPETLFVITQQGSRPAGEVDGYGEDQ